MEATSIVRCSAILGLLHPLVTWQLGPHLVAIQEPWNTRLQNCWRVRMRTAKSDMWSLGIVLHAMSFSTLPFSHKDPSVLKAIIRNFVQERQGLPSEDALTWLPHDPSGRLGSLRFVNAALLDFNPHRRPTTTELLENPKFRVEPITEKNEQDRATLNRRGHWRRMAVRAEQHNDLDVERQGHLTQPHLWPQRQKKRRVRFSNGHKPV